MSGGSCRTGTSAALAAAMLTLTACAASTYAGIDLRPGAADPEIQALARSAQAGDKRAQLELGIKYEEGQGVSRDLRRAEQLYLAAMIDKGGHRYTYSTVVPSSVDAGTMPVSQGPHVSGMSEARQRWLRVRESVDEQAYPLAQRELSLETYLAQRIAAERQHGRESNDPSAVMAITGPVYVRGMFVRREAPEQASELCRAVESLLRRYRDFGFDSCSTWRYSHAISLPASIVIPVVVLDYQDRYEDTEEFRSFAGHVSYRPPFVAEPGTISYDTLCGDFVGYDITLASRNTYRVLIGHSSTLGPRHAQSRQLCR